MIGLLLDRLDLGGNRLGRLCRLGGKILHLGGNDGKAFARFSCPRRLDSGVQCQKVRLLGDVGDQLQELGNLFDCLGEAGN